MENCFVKTYKAACDDNSLPVIDEMVVKYTPAAANEKWRNLSINASDWSMFTVVDGSVGITLSDNAHFENTNGDNLGTEVTLVPNGISGWIVSEDTNEVTITFKNFYNMYNNGNNSSATFLIEKGKNNRIPSLAYTQMTNFAMISDLSDTQYLIGKKVNVDQCTGDVKDIANGCLIWWEAQRFNPNKWGKVDDLIPKIGHFIEGKTEIDGMAILQGNGIGGDASLLPRKMFYWNGAAYYNSNPYKSSSVYTWTLGGRTGADAWILCGCGSNDGYMFCLRSDEDVNNMLIDQAGCTFNSAKASTHSGYGAKIVCRTVSGTYTPSADATTAIATLKSKGITAVIVNGVEL